MGTKFKSNIGTQSNSAGLEQVPPGIGRINQSFLNKIGRTVDRATLRPSSDNIFMQLAGGTVITPLDTKDDSVFGSAYLHPFRVFYAGKPDVGSKVYVRILEGHIIGRMNTDIGEWEQARPSLGGTSQYKQDSIGVPGLDTSWQGGWPSGQKPDTSTGTNPNKPGNNTTTTTKSGSGTHYTSGNGYVSGNAGSVTRPGNGSGIYHSTPSVTGNGNYVSGNAGSITNENQGNSGIYHTPLSSTGNGTYVSGNRGSITNGGNSSAVYNPPLSPSSP